MVGGDTSLVHIEGSLYEGINNKVIFEQNPEEIERARQSG